MTKKSRSNPAVLPLSFLTTSEASGPALAVSSKGSGVKRLILWWASGFLNLLSNAEFAFGANAVHRRQHFRRLYLRVMKISHGNHVFMGTNIHVRCTNNLKLGERCGIGSYARIWNYAPIVIGDDFISAAGLTLNSGGHDVLTMAPFSKSIAIGDRVWCGVNVTILAGVRIGNDVVIGAGSVVTEDLPSNVVAAGVPAKVIRAIDRNLDKFWRPNWI